MENEEIKKRKPKPLNYNRRYLFRMSDKMYEDINNYSENNNITSSDLIRKAIEDTIYTKVEERYTINCLLEWLESLRFRYGQVKIDDVIKFIKEIQ